MTQEDLNDIMAKSMPEWRKEQLRDERMDAYDARGPLQIEIDRWKAYGKSEHLMLELAREEIKKLKDALTWCSGSADFGVDGQAHKGWMKLCEPLLKEMK